jgi:hypothetical protein
MSRSVGHRSAIALRYRVTGRYPTRGNAPGPGNAEKSGLRYPVTPVRAPVGGLTGVDSLVGRPTTPLIGESARAKAFDRAS